MPFIPLEMFANQPQTVLTGSSGTTAPSSGTQETWTVSSSSSFPGAATGATQFHVTDPALMTEIIAVTNVSGGTWTVTRGAEGTTPVTHATGATVVQVVTSGGFAALQHAPWQFPAQLYGAVGDGKIGTGGTGTSGTATFTDAGASFVNATAPAGDVGKLIIINQGTGGGTTNPFCGTISAVNSGTSVTLSANLAANCASAPYIYGTDDAAAINSAVSAAQSWAQSTGNYKAQVTLQPQNYMLGALTQQTSPVAYNTHIPVPAGTALGRKLTIDLVGTGDASAPQYWESAVPSLQGTCLVSAVFATSQPNATFGSQSIVGGPTGTTGLTGGFANTLINVQNITAVAPWNSQQMGFDFRYLGQANLPNASYQAFAPVNLSGATVGGPYLSSTAIVTNGQSVGLYMPIETNNDNCNVGVFTVEGAAFGVAFSEHFTAQRLGLIYCDVCMFTQVAGSSSPVHGATILYASCEASNTCLQGPASGSGVFPVFIGMLDQEVINTRDIQDTNNLLTGVVYWQSATVATPQPVVNGGANLEVINKRQARAVQGAPSYTLGTAFQNPWWQHTWIQLSGGTVTNVQVGPTSAAATTSLATSTPVTFRLPSGWWLNISGSVKPTTFNAIPD